MPARLLYPASPVTLTTLALGITIKSSTGTRKLIPRRPALTYTSWDTERRS